METRPDDQQERVERVIDGVRAHREAIEKAPRGQVRVSWSDGDITVVVEAHYGKEPRRKRS